MWTAPAAVLLMAVEAWLFTREPIEAKIGAAWLFALTTLLITRKHVLAVMLVSFACSLALMVWTIPPLRILADDRAALFYSALATIGFTSAIVIKYGGAIVKPFFVLLAVAMAASTWFGGRDALMMSTAGVLAGFWVVGHVGAMVAITSKAGASSPTGPESSPEVSFPPDDAPPPPSA